MQNNELRKIPGENVYFGIGRGLSKGQSKLQLSRAWSRESAGVLGYEVVGAPSLQS